VVRLDSRHRAKDGRGPLWRNHRDPAADADAEPLRQAIANGDAVIAEIGQRTRDNSGRDEPQRT